MKLVLTTAVLALVAGCAPAPESPASLRSLDTAAQSPTFKQLERTAPTEMAGVTSDRQQAHAAEKQGDTVSAELYADRALARFQYAKLLTERALLNARLRDAEPRATQAEQELKRLGQEQSTRDTRIRELELRVKIAAETEPRTPRSPADSAARQKARLEVAKSFAAEATLLCGAARLLGATAATVDAASGTIPKTADFERAVASRLACLSALESARRAGAAGSPSAAKSDALLEKTSDIGRFMVKRDERGVVITLPSSVADDDLATLGRTARGHAVQVVVHEAGPAGGATAKTRGDKIVKALVDAGADPAKVALELPGSALPVGDPAVPSLRAANERVELVYVQ